MRSCYTRRLQKESKARLLRFRTYNGNMSKIFVERKIHHEKWTGEDSCKNRFTIDGADMLPFLRGHLVNVPEKSKELLHEVQDFIQSDKLYPSVRVEYLRIAFQPKNHDHIRISMDMNVRMIREKTTHFDWYTPEDRLSNEDAILFPFTVVEIKLRPPYIDSPPEWVTNLESSQILIKQNLFSKYGHGIYCLDYLSAMQNPTINFNLRQPSWIPALEKLIEIPELKRHQSFSNSNTDIESGLVLNNSSVSSTSLCTCWESWSMFGQKNAYKKVDSATPPLRVEPKVFFANERTYLTWYQSAIFTSSIGLALVTAGYRHIGILLVAEAIVLVMYASYTYIQRVSSLRNKEPAGYDDLYGPILLGASVAVTFVIALSLT